MIEPGLITADALAAVRRLIEPGVTTLQLDAEAARLIGERGAKSNFQMVRGYRHTICASVNEQVVHGIPNDRPLQRETSSPSTPERSSRGGTATRRSPSSCPVTRRKSWSRLVADSRR